MKCSPMLLKMIITRVRGITSSAFARHGKVMGSRLDRVTMAVDGAIAWPRRLDPKPRHS